MPGQTFAQQAIWTYRVAAAAAVVEAFILFILGLDLTTRQAWLFFFFGFPALVIMYLVDAWFIRRYIRPVQTVVEALDAGQFVTPAAAYRAWVQALNLPTLTLLRVLTIHAPSILLPLTAFCVLANAAVGLGLAWWQFIVLWLFWPITAAPHAILEYFLMDRVVRPVLARLDPVVQSRGALPQRAATPREIWAMAVGRTLPEPRVIRTATAMQLAWFFVFAGVMPMLMLGASAYLKLLAGNTDAIGVWITLLIVRNGAVSVAVVALLSIRVHRSMGELLAEMRRVEAGDLSGQWTPHSTDEFLDLDNGFNQMLAGLRERGHIRETFGRFVSRDVATAVLNGHVPLAGERRAVTILFQDIRGFTGISERLDPAELLRMLNLFFTQVVAAVEAEGGVVKQFTGDGAMALFGAPVAHTDDPDRAVRAALEIGRRLEELNARLRERDGPFLRIGVGIHTGEVVAGLIGPDERVEYGVVGDPVNLASRIEGLTKELGVTILVSRETATRLGPGCRPGRTAVLSVKGKERPVEVVEILGYETTTRQGVAVAAGAVVETDRAGILQKRS